jgi:hypothetical protein
MQTVYLDNNCYKQLLDNAQDFKFLLSLSHSRRGVLSFESSIPTLEEFALIWRNPQRDPRYRQVIRMAHRLVRRDRCVRDTVDLIEQEAAIVLGQRRVFDLWYHPGSPELKLWRATWRQVCNGEAPDVLIRAIDQAKAEHVKLFEEIRGEMQAALKNVTDRPEDLASLIHRYVRGKGLDFMAQIARRQFPKLPSSLDETRRVVATQLHALRTKLELYDAFMFARLAPSVKQITANMGMRGQGRHQGGEFYDVRHGTCGRYVDFFVVEEVMLRFIVNSLDEQNYCGAPYRALSLSEFLEEARRLAQS